MTDIVTTNLVAEYVGKYAKTGTSEGTNAPFTSTWDDLMGTYDMTLSGSFTPDAALGWATSAPYHLQFNGVADVYGRVASAIIDADAAWTLETWQEIPSGTPAARWWYASFHSLVANTPELGFYIQTSGAPISRYTNDAATQVEVTGTTNVTGTTAHLVTTFNGTNMRLYVNGTEEGSPASPTGATTTTTFSLGIRAYNTVRSLQTPSGILTCRIYSSALSLSEVQQNFSAGSTGNSKDVTPGFAGLTVTKLLQG